MGDTRCSLSLTSIERRSYTKSSFYDGVTRALAVVVRVELSFLK
jgi:hypothetical protein